jgi:hypothetical protein
MTHKNRKKYRIFMTGSACTGIIRTCKSCSCFISPVLNQKQCCGSGSGHIRNFKQDPESDMDMEPDPIVRGTDPHQKVTDPQH